MFRLELIFSSYGVAGVSAVMILQVFHPVSGTCAQNVDEMHLLDLTIVRCVSIVLQSVIITASLQHLALVETTDDISLHSA